MRVAVIGGGWYGCHIASTFKGNGAEVSLFEKESALFAEASGNNQSRLHLGLHYPRSAITRHQSRDGFSRFSERYPNFSRPVEHNVYVVPASSSLMDFDTYFSIMYSSGIQIEKISMDSLDYLRRDRISGALVCQERIVRTSAARDFFAKALAGHAHFGHRVDRIADVEGRPRLLGEAYDFVVDATWGSLGGKSHEHYFEPTLLLYYRYRGADRFPALTLVDGELWSIYPTETEGLYTLSSVAHTPLGHFQSKAEAYSRLNETTARDIAVKRKTMEREVRDLFPDFCDRFEYVGPQLSIKTKPVGRTDDRSASIRREGNVFRVNSGKIDTIFHAGDAILGAIFNG